MLRLLLTFCLGSCMLLLAHSQSCYDEASMEYVFIEDEKGAVDLGGWQNNVTIPLYLESYSSSAPVQLAVEFCPSDGESPSLWLNNEHLAGQCNLNSFEGWQNGSWVTVNGWEQVSLCLGDYWGDDYDSRVILHYRVDPNDFPCASQTQQVCTLDWNDIESLEQTNDGTVDIDAHHGDVFVDTLTQPHLIQLENVLSGDWFEVTMSSSQASNLNIAFEEVYDDWGNSGLPDRIRIRCGPQVKVHIRANASGILRFAAKDGYNSYCGGSVLPLDWIRVRKLDRYTLCTSAETCGCQNNWAANYDSSKPHAGVCRFNIQENMHRFAYTNYQLHYIDERGRVIHDGEPDTLLFPAGHTYVALSDDSEGLALTQEGLLLKSGDVLADEVTAFHGVGDLVIAIRNESEILTFGSYGSLNADVIPDDLNGSQIADVQMPYDSDFGAYGVAFLTEDGHAHYFGSGSFSILPEHQGNIVQIMAGHERTFYLTARGELGMFPTTASTNWYFPDPSDIPSEHQGRISSLVGEAYSQIHYLTDDNHFHTAGYSSGSFTNPDPAHPFIASKAYGQGSPKYSLNTRGELRVWNSVVAQVPIWTNYSRTSLACPSCQVTCDDEAACNYLAEEPCIYFDEKNKERLDAGHAFVVALDTLGRLHHWGAGSDTSTSYVEGTSGLTAVRACLSNYPGGTNDQVVLTLDSARHIEMHDLTPDSAPEGNSFAAHYLTTPPEIQGKAIAQVSSHLGRFAALAEDGTLAIWGSNYDSELSSAMPDVAVSWIRHDVQDFLVQHWFARVTYLDGTTEFIVLRDFNFWLDCPQPFTMAGITKDVKSLPAGLFHSGPALYQNGTISLLGKRSPNANNTPAGTHTFFEQHRLTGPPLVDIVSRLFTNPSSWYGIDNRGNIVTNAYNYGNLDDRLSNGTVAVAGYGALTFRISGDGILEPLGYGYQSQDFFGLNTPPFQTGMFCGCNEQSISSACPCVDADEDGVCDPYDPCTGASEEPCVVCGEGLFWSTEAQMCLRLCPTDLNLDGVVALDDLLEFIADYNTDCTWSYGYGSYYDNHATLCGPGSVYEGPQYGCQMSCISDVDGDEQVNLEDLLSLLSAYGLTCD